MNKRILSMDLSMSFPAFAIMDLVEDKVVIKEIRYCDNKKASKLSHGERLHRIADVLRGIAKDYPDIEVVVREKGFSRYANTTQTLFKVVGVSDLEIFEAFGITEIDEISPTSVKRYIAYHGKASKEEVESGVREKLTDEQKDYVFKTDDCSDAVGVGIAWFIQKGYL